MNEMDDLDYKLYVLADLKYKKEHVQLDDSELYPEDWFSSSNYKLKNEMIGEALKRKVLVRDTSIYKKNNTK